MLRVARSLSCQCVYTGLRRGDAAKLGRQHVKDGTITLRTEKARVPVIIPMLPELATVINATKTGDLGAGEVFYSTV
jgi:integrase